MKVLVILLLFLAASRGQAACFVHPETGTVHCSSAGECPVGSGWEERTQACRRGAVPVCHGTEAGAYTPAVAMPAATMNLWHIVPQRAFWTRVGAVVSVTGAVDLIPAGPGAVQFHLEPPITSAFVTHQDAAGVMAARSEAAAGVYSVPDTGSVRFYFEGPGRFVNDQVRYSYAYRLGACP